MTPKLRLISLLFSLCIASIGCSGDARKLSEEIQDNPRPAALETQDENSDGNSDDEGSAPNRPQLGAMIRTLRPLFYREGDYTVISQLSAEHILGGWRTSAKVESVCLSLGSDGAPCSSDQRRTFLVPNGKRPMTLLLPPDVRGKTLHLSVQGKVTLYVDGKTIKDRQLTEGSEGLWNILSFSVPKAESFVRLGIRADRSSRYRLSPGGTESKGAALRWLAFGPDAIPKKETFADAPTDRATPTRALYYPIHLSSQQSPGALGLSMLRDELQLHWIGADGKKEKLPKPSLWNRDGESPKPAGDTYGVVQLKPGMIDGLLEVRSPNKESAALRTTLHSKPLAAGQRSNAADKQHEQAADAELPKPAKNVIVFLEDTLRADKLRIYEKQSRVQTPALDAWAATATRFTAAHTQENWTKPSVATLMTSTMPWQHKATTGDAVLPKRVHTMAELLKKEGFYTGFFSSNGYVSDKFGFGRGWNTYRNYIREGRKNPAQYVAKDVLEWLDKRPKDKRFFLYVHTIDPHVPYRPPSEFSDMYDPEPYSGVVNFRKDATLLENIKVGRIRLKERDKKQLVALYDGEITYHDVWFAKILDGLRERGLDQDTAMVFTSDHGEEFWDHGSVGHGHNVYEELLHIPMVMRIPGIVAHTPQIDSAMGLVDIAPTMFDALGLPVPKTFVGQSQLDLITGADTPTQTSTVSGFMDNWRTIVMGDWKLIVKGNLDPRLYHLTSDPSEQTNVALKFPMITWRLLQDLGLELGRTSSATNGKIKAPRTEKTTIDAKTRAQLRALGYIE